MSENKSPSVIQQRLIVRARSLEELDKKLTVLQFQNNFKFGSGVGFDYHTETHKVKGGWVAISHYDVDIQQVRANNPTIIKEGS
jgi:hypothetical protein